MAKIEQVRVLRTIDDRAEIGGRLQVPFLLRRIPSAVIIAVAGCIHPLVSSVCLWKIVAGNACKLPRVAFRNPEMFARLSVYSVNIKAN